MRTPIAIGFALFSGLIIGGLIVHYIDTHPNEELASKVEWSVVQAVSARHEGVPSDKIEITQLSGYFLVGIPVSDAKKEIWVMLDPRNPPYYKQIPKGNYKLSQADLERILASAPVASTIANCLESHVESQ